MMHFVIYLALGNIVYELQNHKINATQLSKFLHTQGIVPLFFDHVLGLRSPPPTTLYKVLLQSSTCLFLQAQGSGCLFLALTHPR